MPAECCHIPEIDPQFLFHAVARAHMTAQLAGLRRRGLANLGSPKILFVLTERAEKGLPDPSQKELAGLLHISPATVAVSLKSLERYGYVSRKADGQDSRRNLITVTDLGRETVGIIREEFDAVDAYMFHGFSDGEREQVTAFHTRMLQNLYQIGGGEDIGPPPPPRKGC